MSFTFKYDNAKKLLYMVDALSPIIEKTVIQFTKENIEISGMDVNRIAYALLCIEKEDFSQFEISQETIALGINIRELVKILKVSTDNDAVLLEYDEVNPILNVGIVSQQLERKYKIKLMDIEGETFEIPEIDYSLEMDMNCKFYNNLVESINVTGCDQVKFIVGDNKLSLECAGDLSNLEVSFPKNNKEEKRIVKDNGKVILLKKKPMYQIFDCKGEFDISFSTTFLKNFNRSNLSDKLSICVDENMPIKIHYMINEDSGTHIDYHLAPKVSE